jgi:hypothetical protein
MGVLQKVLLAPKTSRLGRLSSSAWTAQSGSWSLDLGDEKLLLHPTELATKVSNERCDHDQNQKAASYCTSNWTRVLHQQMTYGCTIQLNSVGQSPKSVDPFKLVPIYTPGWSEESMVGHLAQEVVWVLATSIPLLYIYSTINSLSGVTPIRNGQEWIPGAQPPGSPQHLLLATVDSIARFRVNQQTGE